MYHIHVCTCDFTHMCMSAVKYIANMKFVHLKCFLTSSIDSFFLYPTMKKTVFMKNIETLEENDFPKEIEIVDTRART